MPTVNSGKRICRECRMISTPGGIGNHQKATGHMGVIYIEGGDSLPRENFEDIVAAAVEVAVSDEKAVSKSMERDYESRIQGLLDQLDETQYQVTLYKRILYALIAALVIFSVVVPFI